MKVLKVGKAPEVIGQFKLDCPEMMFMQYLPIRMPSARSYWDRAEVTLRVPQNLEWAWDIIGPCVLQSDDYVYVTAKHLYVEAGTYPNRPGWHTDGFGTEDINYIWSDSCPTEFCVQDFNLNDDHVLSLKEMDEQACHENIITYPSNTLLRVDNTVVHRVAVAKESGYRTFVKISVSKNKYNLKGNAHNYLFDYNWEMHERETQRNHPIK